MSPWVRLLILAAVGTFGAASLAWAIKGEHKAAAGALIITGLLVPLLFEAIWLLLCLMILLAIAPIVSVLMLFVRASRGHM